MSKKQVVMAYKSAHIVNVGDFVIGEDRVTGLRIGPGMPGFLLLLVELEPCEDCPEAQTERRFMCHPSTLVLEVGEPTEVEVPDEPRVVVPEEPRLVIPRG